MQFVNSSKRLIHLLLIYPHKVIVIGKHGICSLIVWLGRLVSCPVFSNSKQFFSSLSGRALQIGCKSNVKESASKKMVQRVMAMLPALTDSFIWGGESTPVDMDLKNPVEGSGHSRWHLGH